MHIIKLIISPYYYSFSPYLPPIKHTSSSHTSPSSYCTPQNDYSPYDVPWDYLYYDNPHTCRIPRTVSCSGNTHNSFSRSAFFGIYIPFSLIVTQTPGWMLDFSVKGFISFIKDGLPCRNRVRSWPAPILLPAYVLPCSTYGCRSRSSGSFSYKIFSSGNTHNKVSGTLIAYNCTLISSQKSCRLIICTPMMVKNSHNYARYAMKTMMNCPESCFILRNFSRRVS